MKKFILQLFLFCLGCLIVCYGLDVFISSRLKRNPALAKDEYSVWNDIYNNRINSEVVIYGSSRAWVHFNPQIISHAFNVSCYNLGMDGQNFLMQKFRHEELLRYNSPPKLIIYSADIFSFHRYKDLYNYEQFLPYMLFDRRIYNATKEFVAFSVWDFLIPGFRLSGKKNLIDEALASHKNDSGNGRVKGYSGQQKEWNNDLEVAKKSRPDFFISIDESIIREFEWFMKDCENKGIKVIIVYSPEYIEGQRFVSNRAAVIKVFQDISLKFGVPFYDYSKTDISYHKKYFYNASHLNKAGSIAFTELLVADLKNDKQVIESLKNFKNTQ